jgi:hypothetical protein
MHLSISKAIQLLSIQDSSYHRSGLVCCHSQYCRDAKLQSKSASEIFTQWHHHILSYIDVTGQISGRSWHYTLQPNKELIVNVLTLIHQPSAHSVWNNTVWCYMLSFLLINVKWNITFLHFPALVCRVFLVRFKNHFWPFIGSEELSARSYRRCTSQKFGELQIVPIQYTTLHKYRSGGKTY